MRWLRTGAVLGFLAAVVSAGCEEEDPGGGSRAADKLGAVELLSNLENFSTDEELETYLKEQFVSTVQAENYGWYWFDINMVFAGGGMLDTDSDGFSGAVSTTQGSEATAGGYSTTNVQEQGVDESDVVKTDGTHIYVAVGSEVKVVIADPVESMAVLATIPARGRVDSLYLYGDVLIVLYRHGSYYDWYYPYGGLAADIEGIPEGRPYVKTGVLLVDVADPAAPEVMDEMLFEGDLRSSRLTGGRLHLIQRFRPSMPGLRHWYDGTEEDLAAAEAQNQAIVDGLTLDDMIPACYEIDEEGAVAASARLVEAVEFCRPVDPDGASIITVVTIDLEDLSSGFRSVAAVADVDTVYASTRALYLTHTIWSHTQDPQPPPLSGYDYSRQTVIRKFDLTAERVGNCASGRVWGSALNQFSLGEHDGVLRIATTTGFTFSTGERASRNHVFCLTERRGAHLEVTGSIENIAPGERIYSARFVGERGFLVTFRQVDPLFTLDLSDPENPKVVGELKVPGYSEYIHPLGENHLLTIGKDSSPVCLSVFDVTDFADPTLLHKELIGEGWSDSEALRNHKAFTFWAESDLLAVPMHLSEYGADGWRYFTGLYVYRVTVPGGIEFLGRIDTAPEGSSYYYWSGWTRGIFIGKDVYAVTPHAVNAAAVGNLGGEVWRVGLGD